ncbi:MAG: hypothetical protein AABZ44_01050 [Elusimicrobiota bacterium]
MKIRAYAKFKNFYRGLPEFVRSKALRQIRRLAKDMRYPSLRVKKIQGALGIWEARVDRQYRMTFEIIGDTIYLRVIGNHDDTLKNP